MSFWRRPDRKATKAKNESEANARNRLKHVEISNACAFSTYPNYERAVTRAGGRPMSQVSWRRAKRQKL